MKVTAALLLAGMAFGVSLTASAAQAEELRIATQPIPLYAPLYVAKNKKWLDEELAKSSPGTTAKFSTFAAGAPINESFAAGQQDIGLLGDTPTIIGNAAGIERKIIAKTSDGPKTIAVIVGYDSPIHSPKELKGKKVAVPKATYTEHLLSLVLEQNGLTLKDVEQINLPNAEVGPAIIAGSVDAGAVWEPALTRFEAQKAVRVLADGTGLKTGLLAIVATPEAISGKREALKAFLRAYVRGAEFIRTNPHEAAQLVSADVNLPPDLTEAVFAKLNFSPALTDGDVAEFKKTEGYIYSIGLIKNRVDVDAIIDRSVAAEAGLK